MLNGTGQLFCKRIDYDYFDFHYHLKKGGGTTMLDTYINDQLKNLYLNSMGVYAEYTNFSYS